MIVYCRLCFVFSYPLDVGTGAVMTIVLPAISILGGASLFVVFALIVVGGGTPSIGLLRWFSFFLFLVREFPGLFSTSYKRVLTTLSGKS